mgnify:CR=1 FL=1
MIELEPELIVHGLTLAIVLVILVFVGIAYYRTRIRQLLVLLLLAALLGLNVFITLSEDILEEGVPYFGLLTSLLGLGIALLLLITIARRFRWQP